MKSTETTTSRNHLYCLSLIIIIYSLLLCDHALAADLKKAERTTETRFSKDDIDAILDPAIDREQAGDFEAALALVLVGIKDTEHSRRINSGFFSKNVLPKDYYDPRLLLAKVRLLFQLRRFAEAEIACIELIKIFPKYEHGHNALAVIKLAKGDVSGSLKHASIAHSLAPDNIDITDNYLKVMSHSKNAIQSSLFPGSPERSAVRTEVNSESYQNNVQVGMANSGSGASTKTSLPPRRDSEPKTLQRVSNLMKTEPIVEAGSNLNFQKLPNPVAQAELFIEQSKVLVSRWAKDYIQRNPIEYINFYGPMYVDTIGEVRPIWETKIGNAVRAHPYTGAKLLAVDIRVSGSTMFANVDLELEYWVKSKTNKDKERKVKTVRKALEFENIGDKWLIVREIGSWV